MIKLFLSVAIVLSSIFQLDAQTPSSDNSLILSSIKGKSSRPGTIAIPLKRGVKVSSVQLNAAGKENFEVISFVKPSATNGKVVLQYKPSAGFIGIQHAVLSILAPNGKSVQSIDLTGLSTNGLEGENEAPLARIVEALGYKINVGWTSLGNHCKPELQGEEISSALFRKAGSGKVQMIPIARYSPDFPLPFGYYLNANSAPAKHEVGILPKSGEYLEHQTLFPSLSSGSTAFDPGSDAFGFYATGPKHSGYSEDVWNMALHPTDAAHATRIYPVRTKAGKLLPNTYLVCFEEAKNGDYNDYMFLVKNVVPVRDTQFTTLFNGKNLTGWHTYLKGMPANTDPNNNFRIDKETLYANGKDVGYVITDKSFTNYHFKVDFKWGEKKWPPRENAKRDAGICYHISPTGPDSVWPPSIECQIQEGDTGDFWLIGNSTIEVDGKRSTPRDYSRVEKRKDNERTTGEWNTVEVISYNGRCVHIVNGEVVNVGENASLKSGRILLQSEWAEVYYKNIKIREL